MKPASLPKSPNYLLNSSFLYLCALSVSALIATFLVAVSSLQVVTKIAVFVAGVIVYAIFCAGFFVRQRKREDFLKDELNKAALSNAEIGSKLLALEEANQFFGASLKPVDMFRLVSSRINEMIPFAACALFWTEEDKAKLKVVGAVGENARELMNLKSLPVKGAFGDAFSNRNIQFVENIPGEKNVLSAEVFDGYNSALIAPLVKGGQDVFGVLALYGSQENNFDRESVSLLEAIGERVAPLFLSSRAFEQNLSSALTDSITSLPNERAFHLILENQIAESTRFRDDRPLTILTVDIKNFTGLNQQFGHATGDRILSFTAEVIKEQLRQMDFLSRAISDEFLAILPTASEEITHDIQTRIEKAFLTSPFEISGDERIFLKFNFGAASFGKDGETARDLLQKASLRKSQAKSDQPSKIIWFPKEYLH